MTDKKPEDQLDPESIGIDSVPEPEVDSSDDAPPVELLDAESEDTGKFEFNLPKITQKLSKAKSKKKAATVETNYAVDNDPVRLYMREIGLVPLLDADQEFWLAGRLHAVRMIKTIREQHPVVALSLIHI